LAAIDPARVFAAHADAWQAHGRLFTPYGGATGELPGWRLMASGLPYAYLNSACVTDPAVADPGLARAWYSSRGLSWGAIAASGSNWPHGRHLLTQDLMALEPASLSPAPRPAGLAMRRARTEDAGEVVAIDNAAFGSSPAAAHAWLGRLCCLQEVNVALGVLDGLPVAAGYATMATGEAGTTLYIGGIGVVPSARRRGVAAALVTYLLTGGLDRGAAFAHLQTDSERAARLYGRLGFEHCGGIDIYAVD